MLTYGGIQLGVPNLQMLAWIDANISMADVAEFAYHDWPGRTRASWPFPASVMNMPPSIGRLTWPVGASQWAFAHFVVSDAKLAKIKLLAYPKTDDDKYTALPLVMTDSITGNTVETDMYMLPACQLCQVEGGQELYLMTLVDDRYFWWERTGQIVIVENTTTWTQFFAAFGVILDVEIEVDEISEAYFFPSFSLTNRYQHMPPILDLACKSIGHRVVRLLDGTVKTMAARESIDAYEAQYDDYSGHIMAGGRFKLLSTDTGHDLQAAVPETVTLVFPRTDDGRPSAEVEVIATELANLELEEYPQAPSTKAIPGHAGTQLIRCEAVALYSSSVATNADEMQSLAEQASADWYLWRLARLNLTLAGMIPWEPEGMHDVIWTYDLGRCSVRILPAIVQEQPLSIASSGGSGGGDFFLTIVTNNITVNAEIDYYAGDVISIVNNQNNYVLADVPWQRWSSNADIDITGLVAPSPEKNLYFMATNVGSFTITLKHQSASSSAANRIIIPDGHDHPMRPGFTVYFIYDIITDRWRVFFYGPTGYGHSDYIPRWVYPTYAGGEFFEPSSLLADSTLQDDGVTCKHSKRLAVSVDDFEIDGNEDDYDIGDLVSARLDSIVSEAHITGLSGGSTSRIIILENVGDNPIVFDHDSASSAVGNRILSHTADDLTLHPDHAITLKWDGSDQMWRVLWIVPAFAIGPGTENYVTKWITSTTIGDSVIYDDGITDTFTKRMAWVMFEDSVGETEDDFDVGEYSVFRITGNENPSEITGFEQDAEVDASFVRARLLVVINAALVGNVTLKHNDSGSNAQNRILCGLGGADIVLQPGASAILGYDTETAAWRVWSVWPRFQPGSAISDVSGTADGTYGTTEQDMLNDLKDRVNTIISRLEDATIISA